MNLENYEFEPPCGSPIKEVKEHHGNLFVFTERRAYFLNENDLTFSPVLFFDPKGEDAK